MAADLINLGSNGRRRQVKDHVSPYKIALLLMIDEHRKDVELFNRQTDHQLDSKNEDKSREAARYTDAESCTLMFTMLNLVQIPDLDLKSLMAQVKIVSERFLYYSLARRLQLLHDNGIDDLFTTMQDLPNYLFDPDGPLSLPFLQKTSVLGLFVRRVVLAFEKLSFHQVTKLYNKFRRVYTAAFQSEPSKNPDMDDREMSMIFSGVQDDQDKVDQIADAFPCFHQLRIRKKTLKPQCDNSSVDVKKYSQRQAEYFVAQQVFLLNHNELEALSPKEMHVKIMELLQSNTEFAEAHFLSYMNYLRIREYCGAMDSLCHYFDRCLSLLPHPTAANNKSKTPDDETISRGYRYAALNVAAVEYRFGHRKEAIAAIQEAVRIAQENNDSVCLQHALGWLERLGIQNEGGVGYMLDKLITTSGELSLSYLTSLGFQSFARHGYLTSVQPSVIFEYLIKSDIINCQHSLSELMCISYAQKAALWNVYGNSQMCLLNCQLMLNLNTLESTISHNGEPECIALCHIARQHAEQGKYEMAFDTLDATKRRFPQTSCFSHFWVFCEQLIKFDIALFHGHFSRAEQALQNLASVNGLEATFCRCLLLAEKGEISRCLDLAETLIDRCRLCQSSQQPLSQLLVRLLLFKGNILCAIGNSTSAVSPLLEALTISRQSHFTYLAAMALVYLAYAQYCIGLPRQAMKVIKQAVLIIMSHGTCYDRARTHLLWIKCQIAVASPQERKSVLLKSVERLKDIIKEFQQIEAYQRVKDALCYQGLLYDELRNLAERNRCAADYRQLCLQYPTRNLTAASFL